MTLSRVFIFLAVLSTFLAFAYQSPVHLVLAGVFGIAAIGAM